MRRPDELKLRVYASATVTPCAAQKRFKRHLDISVTPTCVEVNGLVDYAAMVALGLYITTDGNVVVAYGARQIPLSCAQYKANGYKPSLEKLPVKTPTAAVPNASVAPLPLGPEARSTVERGRGRYFRRS